MVCAVLFTDCMADHVTLNDMWLIIYESLISVICWAFSLTYECSRFSNGIPDQAFLF